MKIPAITMNEDLLKTKELLDLAHRFYHEVEAPSEEDVETLFFCLIRHDAATLRKFVDSFSENQDLLKTQKESGQ